MSERVAVVSAGGSVTALAAIRSLGRDKVRVVVLHESEHGIGLRSRYAEGRRCPDPEVAEEEFVETLLALGDTFERPVPILPTSDSHLRAIARNAERLSHAFLFPFPVGASLERIQQKRYQVERAAELGIPVPQTSNEPSRDFKFPVLVKPSDPIGFAGEFGAKGLMCDTLEEAAAAVEKTRAYDPIVQEWIPGGDEQLFFLGAYLSPAGEELGVLVGRKIRQVPEGIGTTRVGETTDQPMVAELGLAFLKGIGCHGLSDVEFKLDERDGRFKLMEVNPRLGQWHGLGAAAGVDLPLIAYRDLMGEPQSPSVQTARTKRWAITFLTGSGHERPGFGGNGPVVPRLPYTDAVFALDDPWPAAVQFGHIARGLGRRVRGRS